MKSSRGAPRRSTTRRPWYLLTGFIFGILIGLLYAWWISPVQYVDTPPSSLRADFKDQYRVLVSLSYAVNRNEARARSRLSLLDAGGNDDKKDAMATSAAQLAAQAQRALAEGRPETESQALGILAAALGQKPNPIPSPSPLSLTTPAVDSAAGAPTDPPATPTPGQAAAESSQTPAPAEAAPAEEKSTPPAEPTPSGAFMALPSRTPTEAAPPAFQLKSRQLICDPTLGESQLQIEIQDAQSAPLSGVQALIQWDGGQDVFTTGLKPEKGLGYADFKMEPDISYSLHLDGGEETVTGLIPEECQTSRSERYLGSWLLKFQQP